MDEENDDSTSIDWGALVNTAFSYIPKGGTTQPSGTASTPPNSQTPASITVQMPEGNNNMIFYGIGAIVVIAVLYAVLKK